MELCRQTLEERLDELNAECVRVDDPAGFERRTRIGRQILQAIATVHQSHNLIHRDISLKNIFIGKNGLVKVGDFGLATRCQNLEPLRSSPLSLKPETAGEDECADSFCLDEEARENEELSHGMGTKLFASPEQMSDCFYDQKVRERMGKIADSRTYTRWGWCCWRCSILWPPRANSTRSSATPEVSSFPQTLHEAIRNSLERSRKC